MSTNPESEMLSLVFDDPRGRTHCVSASWDAPSSKSKLRATWVFAHGAGAGPRHVFMQALTDRLLDRDVAVLRYAFPYMEAGRRAPDRPPVLVAAVRAAIDEAMRRTPTGLIFAGGKSMGGRMTSTAVAEGLDADSRRRLAGLVFTGFPLHPAKKPSIERAAHLDDVDLPMLFLQGDRDALADLSLLHPIVESHSHAELHVVADADHGFHVQKRSDRTDDEVLDEVADVMVAWFDRVADNSADKKERNR